MRRRLIVTADDFGMSIEVNEAVEAAHRDGILTCASLVVAGDAAEDAIRRAKRMPSLGVGLHLAIFGARASAAGSSLLAPDGVSLGEKPVGTGISVMFSPSARKAARREIAAQVEAYRRSGLPMGHLDGHWHCHQHPTVLAMALELARPLGLKAVRVPYEGFAISQQFGGARHRAERVFHAVSHWPLAASMRWQVARAGLAANDHFLGKADAGFINELLLSRLPAALPEGVTELGLHPATRNWQGDHAPPPHWQPQKELAALTSPNVKAALGEAGIELVRWSDLA